MLVTLIIVSLLANVVLGAFLYLKHNQIYIEEIKSEVGKRDLEKNMHDLQLNVDLLQEQLDDERIKNAEILSQKKSSETRLGMISEHLVPMLENFPYNPEDAHFLGQPVDYLIYDFKDHKIVFLEVKSGNSKLSKRQKIIKNIIQQGRVFYEEIRINEKGVKFKSKDDFNV